MRCPPAGSGSRSSTAATSRRAERRWQCWPGRSTSDGSAPAGAGVSVRRPFAGVLHDRCALHGADRRLVAHVEQHLALEVESTADAGAGSDDDARHVAAERAQEAVVLVHVKAAIDARIRHELDATRDGVHAAADVGGGDADRAVDVLQLAVHLGAIRAPCPSRIGPLTVLSSAAVACGSREMLPLTVCAVATTAFSRM